MKYIPIALTICFVLSGSFNFCVSQEPLNIDSLKNQLILQENDTNKINTLKHLIKQYKQSAPDQALIYSRYLYKLSWQLENSEGIIDALTEKGRIYIDLGYYDSARYTCQLAIDICDSVNDLQRLAFNYSNYGYLTYLTRSTEEAIKYYRKSYNLHCELADSSKGMANALNGIGAMHMELSKFDSAVYYYLELIKLCEKKNFEFILGKGYINLGIAYDILGEGDKAADYFWKSVKINEKSNSLINLGKAFNSLGNLAYIRGNYEEAQDHFTKAIELSEKANYPFGLADGYIGLGNVYEEKKEYNKAFDSYNLSRKYYDDLQYKEGFLIAYKNQGFIHQQLGNYDQAIIIFDSCLIIAKELNSLERITEIYGNFFITYELKKDYKRAYTYLMEYNTLNDSIINLDKEKIIADLEIKYEKEKYLANNLALKNDNLAKDLNLKKRTNQRNIYMFSGSGSILLFILIISFYVQKTRKDRIIAEQRISRLEEEKKLLAAHAIVEGQEEERKRIAVELHDGLGVLLSSAKIHFTSLRNKTPENRPLIDKASKLLQQATKDLRRISHNMMPGLLTKYGLYEAVGDLFEQLNDSENLTANLIIEGDTARLKENTEIMNYRIIQEMVNNTLKHAKAKNITLNINILPDKLRIIYIDDGIGFNADEKMRSKSMGLLSIQSRVKFLNGDLRVESEPGKGVNYSFEIPLS